MNGDTFYYASATGTVDFQGRTQYKVSCLIIHIIKAGGGQNAACEVQIAIFRCQSINFIDFKMVVAPIHGISLSVVDTQTIGQLHTSLVDGVRHLHVIRLADGWHHLAANGGHMAAIDNHIRHGRIIELLFTLVANAAGDRRDGIREFGI